MLEKSQMYVLNDVLNLTLKNRNEPDILYEVEFVRDVMITTI